MKLYTFSTPKGDFKAAAEHIRDAFNEVKEKQVPGLTWDDCKKGTVVTLPKPTPANNWPTPAA